MTDHQLELANAYLDGEASATERAIVESDAALLAEVERMRAVRNALSDIEAPSDAARESAIAAALAAFDDLRDTAEQPSAPPPADVTAPANIVPFERRRRIRRIQGLSAAAAAIVIVGGGVAITQRGDDRDTSSGADDAAITLFEAPAPTEREGPATDAPPAGLAPPTTTGEPMMAVVPTTAGYEAANEAGDAALASNDIDTAAAAASVDTSAAGGAAPSVPAAPVPNDSLARLEVLRDEDDLIELAALMKDPPMPAADAEAECAGRTLKADAEYEEDDGTTHPIVVVIFGADPDALGALTLDDCEFVLRVD